MERSDGRTERKKKVNEDDDGSEPLGIERLLGIAMGCMGMSMDDFCRCTPSEYNAIYREWHDHRERQVQTQWEMARMECLCTLQPYSRKRLTARDVMTFPWEEEKSEERRVKNEETESGGQKQMSHEEFLERYRKAARRAGLKRPQ